MNFFLEKLMAKLDTIQKRVDDLSEVCMARNVCDKGAADATQLQAGTMRVLYWSDTVYFVEVPRIQLVEKVTDVPRPTVVEQCGASPAADREEPIVESARSESQWEPIGTACRVTAQSVNDTRTVSAHNRVEDVEAQDILEVART